MRKRVGIIKINPQQAGYNKEVYKDIPIWGTLWKTEDTDIYMTGVYFNLSPRQFLALTGLLNKIMTRIYSFTIKLKTDEWGTRYQVGIFCKQGEKDLDLILRLLKSIIHTAQNDEPLLYSATTEMKDITFKDIIKESVVKSL